MKMRLASGLNQREWHEVIERTKNYCVTNSCAVIDQQQQWVVVAVVEVQ